MAVDIKNILKWVCIASVCAMLILSILGSAVWNNTCSNAMVAYFKGLTILGLINGVLIIAYYTNSTVRTYLPEPITVGIK